MLEEAGIQTTRRDPKDDPEGTAFAVAWSAVEKKYEKRKGRWVQKD
jgi:cation transport regulator ChaB